MKERDKYCLNKLLSGIDLENGIQCKREIHIIKECLWESTLDIWSVKSVFFSEINQYEIYKCFILKFEFSFAGFMNPNVDLFHYMLKGIAYSDKVDKINANNIKTFYENSLILDGRIGSEFVKNVIYENGSWYLKG